MMLHPRTLKGFTLVELLVAIAILAILATLAAPSFNSFIDKYRVKRAADTISAFLINTKSEAIKRNTTVHAVFQTADSGATWCVGMTAAAAGCDCTAANSCQIDGADRLVRGSDYRGIVLENPADGTTFSFTPQRGTSSIANNAQVKSANGMQIRVVVKNTTGRIRVCSPGGSGNVGGYPAC